MAPVPNFRFKDPRRRDFENVELVYTKEPKYYTQNKFLPDNIASLKGVGTMRESVIGTLTIYPCQYNPVTRVLKQYTRVRVRINFGQAPITLTRKRSKEETSFLTGVALNSNIAINWMNPKLAVQKPVRVTGDSHMATGDWYRIEIQDNGSGTSDAIYKMNKSFLESAGINLTNVDPRTIKMYGNGGEMMPENITLPRPEDLVELAIYIDGEADGHFDPQDYILFYGKSVNNWTHDITYGYAHYLNIYSKSNYYWICINTSGNGKRMLGEPSENVSNPYIAPAFSEKLFFEPEVNNLVGIGNVWLSERKSNGESFIWNNTLTGLQANSDILYKIKPASRMFCGFENHMLLQEANSVVSPIPFTMGCIYSGYGDWIWTQPTQFTINASQKNPPNSEQSSFVATYYSNSPDAEGYLDWMEIIYQRKLNSVTGDFLRFDSPIDSNVVIEYNLSPFSGNQVRVFDATEHENVKLVQPLAVSSSNVKFQELAVGGGQLSKFFAIGPNGYKTPTSISQRMPNQNLHNGYNEGASFIIITHPDFISGANRLKTKRETGGPGNPNYLKTFVFDIYSIYNEFSGGLQDPVAIRDFIKYATDHWQIKPVYVCFMGDGSYDYRNILLPFSNWVPPYEFTDPNINQVTSYTSDDFFVQLSPDNPPIPQLAHGRIPARTITDVNSYLDKVDCYEDPSHNGYWKNKAIFVADDGNITNDGSQHTDQCEVLAEQYTIPTLDKKKIYLVMYPAVVTSQGLRKPAVNADIIKYWNEGAISINYTGHGSPEVWSHEFVFEKTVAIAQLNNLCLYPFLTVASCDFSHFDDPINICGGELLNTTPNKGTIGTLASTRPVYGSQNTLFNNLFWRSLEFYRDTLLLPMRFGKAVYIDKQTYNSVNDLKFELLCDPTLRVQIPRFQSKIDSISGLNNDTMRALSRIKIYGSIIRPDSSFWSDYNGNIYLKIFDVDKHITIIDEETPPATFNFKLPGGIIYSGTQNIINGKWVITYIVPKDISYLNQNGKIINYFYNNQSDGSGLYTNFIVGGIDPTAAVDTTGPDIKLFINTRNFRSGDVVNENFKLLGDLFDESGINTTGTIGHKIEATLDNNDNNKYDLTSFYNSDTTYKSGHLEYDFTGVAEGHHTLKVKAWDTYNNSSEASIDFVVSIANGLRVMNVYNYPNPFKDRTAFTFQHNYPDPINVQIKIYTVAGRLIKEIQQNDVLDKFVVIDWSGKDADGESLANGIYIYKLVVTTKDGQTDTNVGKLAVLK
ncbi:MAG: type IX secretion system sortase PorU [Ignavibacteria bacterium]